MQTRIALMKRVQPRIGAVASMAWRQARGRASGQLAHRVRLPGAGVEMQIARIEIGDAAEQGPVQDRKLAALPLDRAGVTQQFQRPIEVDRSQTESIRDDLLG